jgi:preprotein translocase subunit SecG
LVETILTVFHVLVALFMILVVLVQGGNSGGVGAAFGGSGNSRGVLGATGATTLFGKLTYGAAGIFMVTSILLSVLQGTSGSGHSKRLDKAVGESTSVPAAVGDKAKDQQPVSTDKPAAENAAPAVEGNKPTTQDKTKPE